MSNVFFLDTTNVQERVFNEHGYICPFILRLCSHSKLLEKGGDVVCSNIRVWELPFVQIQFKCCSSKAKLQRI